MKIIKVLSMTWAIWITGLPGSGKSTITRALSEKLRTDKVKFDILGMDELRRVVTPKPTYSKEERETVYAALVYAALVSNRNCVNVLIDATGNRRRYRDKARILIPQFFEVYVKCPLDVCIERERSRKVLWDAPREVYDKAFKGVSRSVPGIGEPYEEPLKPEVVVDSSKLTPSESAQIIYLAIKRIFG